MLVQIDVVVRYSLIKITNSKTILFIKRFDKPICASNNSNGRNKSKGSYGNVDNCLVRSYNSATSSIRILFNDDIIDQLETVLCSSLTCSLFNEFLFSFDRCYNV
ncbi:unnamed protein product [Rotaria sp. Silwood2]|nr:unnamed protein product [Rotaria sp. Silwood2]